jgi:DNA-binding MarR family transcriptional regulator
MTQLVQRLERQGLVERNRDPGDRRLVWVNITDAGRRLLADRRRARAAELAEVLATLPPEEEAALGAAVAAALPVIRKLAERRPVATPTESAAQPTTEQPESRTNPAEPLTPGRDR